MKKYFQRGFYKRYQPHYIPNIKLALPVVFSQAGQMVVALADTLMVGQLGSAQLAAVSFANSVFVLGFVFIIGLAIGITPLVGKAYGSGKREECGGWLKYGLQANFLFSILLFTLMYFVSFLMKHMGQDQKVVELAIPYYRILVYSILPFSIFMVFKQFSEGVSNTRIAMIITLVANVINIFLNYLLIYGKAGFPAMGVDGAGWATFASRIIMAIAFVIVFIRLPFFSAYKKAYCKASYSLKKTIEVLKVGFPVGGQMALEVFAFSMGAIMMGWIGEDFMAAHQIVISIASFTYMMAYGLSSAATIKVSHFYGAKEYENMKYAAYAIIHKVIIFMGTNGVVFVLLNRFLPFLFVGDEVVINIAAKLMIVAGFFQVFDGLQVAWLGILRGVQDVKAPSVISFVSWVVLALPICYICAFVFKMGGIGVWVGYLCGLFIASTLLMFRFRKVLHKIVADSR